MTTKQGAAYFRYSEEYLTKARQGLPRLPTLNVGKIRLGKCSLVAAAAAAANAIMFSL